MEEAALLVDVKDLHRLEHLSELGGGDVSVDVEKLAVLGLGERGEDGKRAGLDRCLDGRLVDSGDASDVGVLLPVEVFGGKDAVRDGTRAGTKGLKGSDELEVLLEEDAL